ncbi:MAG: hypothetical protein WBF33_20770 [Candidatus Nitrosopolaris sp.]
MCLETYTVLQNIDKIKEFMFADIDKTISLIHSDIGAPNFMLALVLCSYTEFWGKLMLPSQECKKCFEAFFRKLGTKYVEVMDHRDTNIYGRIRCGLVHEYLIKGNAKIVIEGGECGIIYDENTKTYTFHIRRYLEDFNTIHIYPLYRIWLVHSHLYPQPRHMRIVPMEYEFSIHLIGVYREPLQYLLISFLLLVVTVQQLSL